MPHLQDCADGIHTSSDLRAVSFGARAIDPGIFLCHVPHAVSESFSTGCGGPLPAMPHRSAGLRIRVLFRRIRRRAAGADPLVQVPPHEAAGRSALRLPGVGSSAGPEIRRSGSHAAILAAQVAPRIQSVRAAGTPDCAELRDSSEERSWPHPLDADASRAEPCRAPRECGGRLQGQKPSSDPRPAGAADRRRHDDRRYGQRLWSGPQTRGSEVGYIAGASSRGSPAVRAGRRKVASIFQNDGGGVKCQVWAGSRNRCWS